MEDVRTPETAPERAAPPRRPWLAPAVACAVALAVLLILLIPGVLRYGESAIDEASVIALEEANATLEREVSRLARGVQTGVCTWDGDLYPRSVERSSAPPSAADRFDLLPPPARAVSPARGAIAPGPGRPARAAEQDEPDAAGSETAAAFAGSIDDLLRASTVLVLALGEDSFSSGTGFFVDDTHIVTNAHVTDGRTRYLIANDFITDPVVVELVASTGAPPEAGGPDFALLRLGTPQPSAEALSFGPARRTQDVYASGYPGFFVRELVAEYVAKVARGEPATPPESLVTSGMITTVQDGDSALQLVPHTADISAGNSGGPLIDTCGRAVGINTYGRQNTGSGSILVQGDYALGGSALTDFLARNGAAPRVLSEPCESLR
ncbi:serine protease [Jannaschia sp. W003]|uniref:S1 family peptidase n=1 Tax=Jannaschia sp. W003 TaxID=2867012 RepID=UPI0021A76EBD|nr:serine protease [Jannaschia sp. W003]UWQ23090.1 serine protease [Jannaschia sp. W003]